MTASTHGSLFEATLNKKLGEKLDFSLFSEAIESSFERANSFNDSFTCVA